MTPSRRAFESRASLRASSFGTAIQHAPALSWLAATSALASVLVEHVVLPVLRAFYAPELLRPVVRGGDFATNLAAIAALVALCIALLAFTRQNPIIALPRRLLLAGFSGVLLPTLVIAIVLERARTTIELVLFALGAAYAVMALANASAAGIARAWLDRVLASVAAMTATTALVAQAFDTLSRSEVAAWIERSRESALAATEVGYLLLLVCVTLVALPDRSSRRNRGARLAAFFVLPLVLGALYAAERTLGKDYALALYAAQRVHVFSDLWPRLYAVPLALALAGGLGGALGSEASRSQAGAAAILIVASGSAPLAPGALITLTLGMLLVARVVAARTELGRASVAVEARNGAPDPIASAVDQVEPRRIAEP